MIQKYGIVGILVATSLTYWVVDFLYNPVLVYKRVFKQPSINYYKMMFVRVAIALLIGSLGYSGCQAMHGWVSLSFIHFLLGCMALGCSVLIVVTLIYMVSFSSFRDIIKRFMSVLFKDR